MSLEQVSGGGTEGDFQHPNENLRRSTIIALYFAFIMSTVAVALRLLARKITGSRLYLDDYLMIIALSVSPDPHPMVITNHKQIGWSNSFVYTLCVMFIKLSILAVYKRLFAARSMKIAANIVAVIVVLWAVSISIGGVLNCVPVQKFWDRAVPGHCVNTVAYYYGQQIPNILTDVVLLIMPLKSVWELPISKTQRLLLSGVFLVGILTLIFDILRLVAMIELTQAGPDITCEYMFFFSSALTYKALMIPHRQPSPSRRVDMHGGSSGNHSGMHVSYPTSFQPQALVSN
ncbi:hypothetical protein ASPNIDRAFT_125323, partial [Aspergillus niger ATCC 1015]